jgi:hypothetical protein
MHATIERSVNISFPLNLVKPHGSLIFTGPNACWQSVEDCSLFRPGGATPQKDLLSFDHGAPSEEDDRGGISPPWKERAMRNKLVTLARSKP